METLSIKTFATTHRSVPASAVNSTALARTCAPAGRAYDLTSRDRLRIREILGGPRLQPKLAVGPPDDKYEREADRVAEQVLRMPDPTLQRTCSCGGRPEGREDDDIVQSLFRKSNGDNEAGRDLASPIVNDVVNSIGQPLDSKTRAFFDPRFGFDFSRVRVHTDALAARSARAVNARAYAVGSHLVFGTGEYSPLTPAGQALMAHELAHVALRHGHPEDRIRRQPSDGGLRPPAAATAYSGIDPYYMVEQLPYVQYGDPDYIIRAGDYILGPNMLATDPPTVVFYLAYRLSGQRNEWVVGPASVEEFIRDVANYERLGNLAYAWLPPGQQIPAYQASSARAVYRALEGDIGGYFSGLREAWGAAFRDPGWWMQAITATAGAGVRAPAAPLGGATPPALRVIPGGGGAAAPVAVAAPRVAAPVLATEGSLAVASVAPQASAPVVIPRLTVLQGGGMPAPTTPVNTLPLTAGVATGVVSTTAPGVVSVPVPAPKTSDGSEGVCRSDPCPQPLPINWPVELPYPPTDYLIRTPADVREAEGLGERGAAQQTLAKMIRQARELGMPPPSPCDPDIGLDPGRWNAPFDAHHMQPLYLGGVDASDNLCALEADLHQIGHPRLDNQSNWLDVYIQCGICSGYLTDHPAYQEYYVAGSK